MNTSNTNEAALEACIERYLVGDEGTVESNRFVSIDTPVYASKGYVRGDASDFKPEFAIDEAKFWQFLEAPQVKELGKLQYKADWKRQILERLQRKLKKDGILAS